MAAPSPSVDGPSVAPLRPRPTKAQTSVAAGPSAGVARRGSVEIPAGALPPVRRPHLPVGSSQAVAASKQLPRASKIDAHHVNEEDIEALIKEVGRATRGGSKTRPAA